MIEFLVARPPDLLGFLFIATVLVVSLTIHEFAHAAAATWQGDPTARLAGRLTLNPMSHLDPVGSVMIVLVGFGWGKPVPFSPNKLRSRRFGAAFVGAAGPLTNIALAFLAAFILGLLGPASFGGPAERFLGFALSVNVVLAIFNLLPIPPLDGSRILTAVLPPSRQHIIYFLDKWSFILLIVVAFLLFRPVLGPVVTFTIRLILRVAT